MISSSSVVSRSAQCDHKGRGSSSCPLRRCEREGVRSSLLLCPSTACSLREGVLERNFGRPVVLKREVGQEHCPKEKGWKQPWKKEMKKRNFAQLSFSFLRGFKNLPQDLHLLDKLSFTGKEKTHPRNQVIHSSFLAINNGKGCE